MNEFLQRLKKGKLVQWGLAYVSAAFSLLQGIDIVAQRFDWPESVRGLVLISKDAFDGPICATYLAMVHAWGGEKDLALEELKLSASIPGGVLELWPAWDSPRVDPRFERILLSLAPEEPSAAAK